MSISISYSTTYGANTVAEYLSDWSAFFGDLNHREGSVKEGTNTGGFNPGPFDGTQYGVSSTVSNAAVVADGDLHYTLFNPPSHTLWGSLDALNLGSVLAGGATTGGYTITHQEVSFTDLGLSSLQSEGRDGQVHQIIYGLMSGDSSALASAIDSLLKDIDPSLSINSTFDQLATAGVAHLDTAVVAASDVALVGVQDVPQDFALAA